MSPKPKLELQTTTLWDYPSQHYSEDLQGDPAYAGATPSYVIWNVLQRYTRPGDLVVDPMCGSGTTIDVAHDLERRVRGFDLAPFRKDIEQADARKVPLPNSTADFVFVDPPYGTHIDYSEHPACIGKLEATSQVYYRALEGVIAEIARILKPRRYMALYVCDSFKKRQPFAPIGFRLFGLLEQRLRPVDVIAVVRRNRTLKRRHYHTEAEKGNYFLRGFNYLLIFKKEPNAPAGPKPRGKRPRPPAGRRRPKPSP